MTDHEDTDLDDAHNGNRDLDLTVGTISYPDGSYTVKVDFGFSLTSLEMPPDECEKFALLLLKHARQQDEHEIPERLS